MWKPRQKTVSLFDAGARNSRPTYVNRLLSLEDWITPTSFSITCADHRRGGDAELLLRRRSHDQGIKLVAYVYAPHGLVSWLPRGKPHEIAHQVAGLVFDSFTVLVCRGAEFHRTQDFVELIFELVGEGYLGGFKRRRSSAYLCSVAFEVVEIVRLGDPVQLPFCRVTLGNRYCLKNTRTTTVPDAESIR